MIATQSAMRFRRVQRLKLPPFMRRPARAWLVYVPLEDWTPVVRLAAPYRVLVTNAGSVRQ